MKHKRRGPKQLGGATHPQRNFRISFVFSVMMLLFFAVIGRLYQVQIVWHDRLLDVSDRQYYKTFKTRPYRGTIFDRAGREVAVTVEADSLFVNPTQIEDPYGTADSISKVTGIKKSKLVKQFKRDKKFLWIDRQIIPRKAKILRDMKLKGIGFIKESRRYYPSRDLAARTVGFVGVDNQGLAGLEYYYDSDIRIKPEKKVIERGGFSNGVVNGLMKKTDGAGGGDLILTFDKVIQYFAEKELKKQVEATNAVAGVVIVMDPKTGEVLAMADQPQFNLNEYGKYNNELWTNKAVSHVFEPGSTFKILLAASALESGMAYPEEVFYCENGSYEVHDITIHEANYGRYEDLTFREILSKSSNIGAVKIGERLEPELFYSYLKKFGIGSKTGIDLPGESHGLFQDPDKWSGTSLAAISFGQEVSVTPIQLITAISAVANGGLLIRPRVVKEIRKNGESKKMFKTEVIRRVISEETSKVMTELLEFAVNEGTGKNARIPGIRVAGKTGTAQKAMPEGGGYSKDKFISTFVGYLPAESPRLAILVIIDEPEKNIYGGRVAAPVFKNIAEQTLRYMNILSETDPVYEATEEPTGIRLTEIANPIRQGSETQSSDFHNKAVVSSRYEQNVVMR